MARFPTEKLTLLSCPVRPRNSSSAANFSSSFVKSYYNFFAIAETQISIFIKFYDAKEISRYHLSAQIHISRFLWPGNCKLKAVKQQMSRKS